MFVNCLMGLRGGLMVARIAGGAWCRNRKILLGRENAECLWIAGIGCKLFFVLRIFLPCRRLEFLWFLFIWRWSE